MITAEMLFRLLQKMDKEATPRIEVDGVWRTGLCWYFGHERRNIDWPKRDDSERSWCRRLVQILPGEHEVKSAVVDHPYPDGSGYTDIMAEIDSGGAHWLEVKGAWTAQCQHVPCRKNRNLAKHLTGQKESLANDFVKMARLTRSHARYL